MGQGPLTCVMDLEIVDDLPTGLVLGRDWFAYYREYLIFEGRLPLKRRNFEDGARELESISGPCLADVTFRVEHLFNNRH